MLPFDVSFAPGDSPSRQVVYAATKAILTGVLAPGEAFPSVRELSQALKINPNTAQKIVAELVAAGLLVVQPGLGTVVARAPKGDAASRQRVLTEELERLLIEARRTGIRREDLQCAIDALWMTLFGPDDPVPPSSRTVSRPVVSNMRGRR